MNSAEDSLPTTGQGTEPATEASEAAKARRLANLRPPFRKGETGNPTGYNGRGRATEIAQFLDKPESIESNRTRFEAVVDRLFRSALRGDTQAARVLIEYKLGKPRVSPNTLDLAEHLRRVALNQAELALDVLGPRLHSTDPVKFVEFLRACKDDTSAFLNLAEKFAHSEDSQESQPAQDESKLAEGMEQSREESAETPADVAAPGGKP